MNEQNSGRPFNTWDIVERTEQDTNGPLANSDPLADEVPVEAALVDETPMGGTVAGVGPLDETITHEAPMAEAIPYKAPVGEPVADESGAQ